MPSSIYHLYNYNTFRKVTESEILKSTLFVRQPEVVFGHMVLNC